MIDEKRIREQIATYIEHVATSEIGSIFNSDQRRAMLNVARWVRDRIDEAWAQRDPKRALDAFQRFAVTVYSCTDRHLNVKWTDDEPSFPYCRVCGVVVNPAQYPREGGTRDG